MKTLTVRLPAELAAQIEAESRERKVSKSDVVRERLRAAGTRRRRSSSLESIIGLIGSPRALTALTYAAQADSDRDVRRSAQFAVDVIQTNSK